MTMQFKEMSPVMEIKSIEASGVFSGYASVFSVTDSQNEKTVPGCFAKSLADHKQRGTRPKLFWQHSMREPIGKWLDMAEDGRGLYVEGKLNMGVQRGREAYELLKEGDIDGLSIGYIPEDWEPDPKKAGVTLLKRVNLLEVSVVSIGSNRSALINDVKSDRWADLEDFARKLRDGEPPAIKEFEGFLRDAGIPRSMAVRIASVGYAKAIRSDSECEDSAKTAANDVLRDLRAAVGGFLNT